MVAFFLTSLATAAVFLASSSTATVRKPKVYAKNYDWLTCDEFLDHSAYINAAVGLHDPRHVPGYSNKACETVFHAAKKVNMVDNIVNLGSFFNKNKMQDITAGAIVPDVAGDRRRDLQLSDSTCSFTFGFGNPGELSDASPIGACVLPLDQDECPHDPCVPEYLQADVGTDNDDPFETYEEFIPGYGGDAQYEAFTASIEGLYWNGCERDRTDAGPVGTLLIFTALAQAAELVGEVLCDTLEDDIELCVGVGFGPCFCSFCIDLPNPGLIGCAIAKGVLAGITLGLETAETQVGFQDGLVDGAEIEAAYEHSVNLLQKQCAIFDQAVCRCVEQLGIGSGCDGIDSDCDDLIDECDEDIIPPEIKIDDALCACDGWFSTSDQARECVEATTVIQDDCQELKEDPLFLTTGTCQNASVLITATDACDRSAADQVPVLIDGDAPLVSCDFAKENGNQRDDFVDYKVTGPGRLKDVGLIYTATDTCGLPLNVTVEMYASEIEDFNAQEMALFFRNNNTNDRAELYLATAICPNDQNGQCIKDPEALDARLYTAVVSATDVAGNTASAECQVRIIPNGNLNKKDVDVTDSTQRFFLTSYTSVFSDY